MLRGNGVIGVRREEKSKWERRVSVTPSNVRELVAAGLKVLVQPSTRRVFPDEAYVEAGAELTEDLSPASLIVGVKEVPVSLLLPERTYLFFSHTIKAQPYNMPLLDAVLERKVRLVDYECITSTGERGGPRLVAFGKFAGIAGAIDFLRGLGERFLAMGFSTPFLHVASAYMYPSVAAAYAAVRACGAEIAKYGLPAALCPFTVAFTGNGNVSTGAQEVWDLLPVERVAPGDLQGLVERARTDVAPFRRKVFLTEVLREHMVQRRREEDGSSGSGSGGAAEGAAASGGGGGSAGARGAFDAEEYTAHPERYEPTFHTHVAPYLSVLFVTHYWDARFPRLLTTEQTRELHRQGKLRMLGICDITCDAQGAVEFLREFTSIENPFYVFDFEADRPVHDLDHPRGILYHAVDHLPSEVPLEASEHFGRCLAPFLAALARSDGSKPFDEQNDLPKEVRGAVITAHGKLTPSYVYIAKLREASQRAQKSRGRRLSAIEQIAWVRLDGHLFDTGVINLILDLLEGMPDVSANIADVKVGRNVGETSSARIQLFAPVTDGPDLLADAIRMIAKAAASRDCRATMDEAAGVTPGRSPSPGGASGASGAAVAASDGGSELRMVHFAGSVPRAPPGVVRRVLLLGAGMVSAPAVDYVLRRPNNTLTVAAVLAGEAERLCRNHKRATPAVLNAAEEVERLRGLVHAHDVVISLLPAFLHPLVADACIAHRRPLVTASYVAPAMAAKDAEAREAGVLLLNEIGLDPGIDHMTAMRALEQVRAQGGATARAAVAEALGLAPEAAAAALTASPVRITAFRSVCGGLPAPEDANNPLAYKFSWAPRGVFAATTNDAKWQVRGEPREVPSEATMLATRPWTFNAALRLEVVPNRDSVSYISLYELDKHGDGAGPGAPAAAPLTFFRGTLRFLGYADQIFALRTLGFLDLAPESDPFADEALCGAGGSAAGVLLRAWLVRGLRRSLADAEAADVLGGVSVDADDATLFEAVRVAVARVAAAAVRGREGKAPLLRPEDMGYGDGCSGEDGAGAPVAAADLSVTSAASMRRLRTLLLWMRCLGPRSRTADGRFALSPAVHAARHGKAGSSLDAFALLMESQPEMQFQRKERDMVLMQHVIEYEADVAAAPGDAGQAARNEGLAADGRPRTVRMRRLSTLAEFRAADGSAMARTVGLPVGIATQLILDGTIRRTGIARPTSRDVWVPILEALEAEGVHMHEDDTVVAL